MIEIQQSDLSYRGLDVILVVLILGEVLYFDSFVSVVFLFLFGR